MSRKPLDSWTGARQSSTSSHRIVTRLGIGSPQPPLPPADHPLGQKT